MLDKVSIPRVATLHPIIRTPFQEFIEEVESFTSRVCRLVEAYRTFAYQDMLYAKGRTAPGEIVTWSPAGTSYHNYGLAGDICLFYPDQTLGLDWKFDFKILRPIAIKYGFTWGGDFPKGKTDLDHFENKCGFNWRDLLDMYHRKDFIPGTQYLNLTPAKKIAA